MLNIQGTGLLDDTYSSLINGANFFLGSGTGLVTGGILSLFAGTGLGAIAIAVGYGVGAILALGNYEGNVDFVVNALPNQQQLPIYHGRLSIYKDVVFGLFTTHFLNYANDNNSSPSMLPYDSAPGGIYDINQLSKGALSQISSAIPIAGTRSYVQPTFCFVPTTSALDIGGGNVALGSQDLTASYVNTAPPAAPRNTPFANFITNGRENLTHILWNGLNSKWAFQEMQATPQNLDCLAFCQVAPTISGPDVVCGGSGSTFTVSGVPAGTLVTWSFATTASVSTSAATGASYTVTSTGAAGSGTVQATISSDCGQFTLAKQVIVGKPALLVRKTSAVGEPTTYEFTAPFLPGAAYQWYSNNTLLDETSSVLLYYFPCRATRTISYAFTNDCTTTATRPSITITGECQRSGAMTLAPNPTADEVTVQQTDTEPAPNSANAKTTQSKSAATAADDNDSSSGITAVRFYDSYGQLRLEQAGHEAHTVHLRVSQLPAGFYVVHILQGEEVVSRQQFQITR